MTDKFTEAIFEAKNNLHTSYPLSGFSDVRTFDLERKHLLYGKVDRKGDAVLIKGSNLQQIYTGKNNTEWAVDFVCDAFTFLRRQMERQVQSGYLSSVSLYNSYIKVHKAYRDQNPSNTYYSYIDKLYSDFVGRHLQVNRRHEKIKNFDTFMEEFFNYIIKIAYYFPITKTGWVLSTHCSPYTSGLMIDIARERHGTFNNANVVKFITDRNFIPFVSLAKKHGFMVDKNAPWRLIFNVMSGNKTGTYMTVGKGELQQNTNTEIIHGGLRFMDNYGVDSENVFSMYYDTVHDKEIDSLKDQMYAIYAAFYNQNSTYTKLEHHTDNSGLCSQSKVQAQFLTREAAPSTLGAKAKFILSYNDVLEKKGDTQAIQHFRESYYSDEYWLKIILKLRLVESNTKHDGKIFKAMSDETISRYRMFGKKSSLEYINSLTKGMYRTKFNRHGKYWYGNPKKQYENIKSKAISDAESPDQIDYDLTGILNKK
jgi:ribosomal protein L20A (L18A)